MSSSQSFRSGLGLFLAIYATIFAAVVALFPLTPERGFFASAGWMMVSFSTVLLTLPAAILGSERPTLARVLLVLAAGSRITLAMVFGDVAHAVPLALVGLFLPAALALTAAAFVGPFSLSTESTPDTQTTAPAGVGAAERSTHRPILPRPSTAGSH